MMGYLLRKRLDYPRFASEKVRILLIRTRYFLVSEVISACKKLDWPVRSLKFNNMQRGSEDFIKELLWALVDFRPDFLLTINHFGFDEEGKFAQLLSHLRVPCASWFVDSPFFVLRNYNNQVSPYIFLFLWDGSYTKFLREKGFENIATLPLATDTDRFCPAKISYNPLRSEACSLSFVGDSLVNGINKEALFLDSNSRAIKLAQDLGRKIGIRRARTGKRMASYDQSQYEKNPIYRSLNNDQKIHFHALTTWKASQAYRLSLLKKVAPLGLRIYGDAGWRGLNGNFRYHRPLSYYRELPYFFNVSKINLNATSLQMEEAINQRVFDASACGSFIITDYQKQLEDLFCIKEEIVCFRDEDELFDLCRFYLNHPQEREKKAARARERVLKEHSYQLRLIKMAREMKKVFG